MQINVIVTSGPACMPNRNIIFYNTNRHNAMDPTHSGRPPIQFATHERWYY